jgi:hypothetical protein
MTILAACVASGMLLAEGCGSNTVAPSPPPAEETDLLAALPMAHPDAPLQLLRGFHEVEQGAWRWTMQRFSLLLQVPELRAVKGIRLRLDLTVPEPVLRHFPAVTLSAAASGVKLAPATYRQPGDYTYIREVPQLALTRPVVRLEFTLDHSIPPSHSDPRELGIVIRSASLEPN